MEELIEAAERIRILQEDRRRELELHGRIGLQTLDEVLNEIFDDYMHTMAGQVVQQ